MQMRTESWNAEMKLSLCTSKFSELYEKISIYTLGEFVFLVYKGNLKVELKEWYSLEWHFLKLDCLLLRLFLFPAKIASES